MQAQAVDNMWQHKADMMDQAHRASEGNLDRTNNLAIAQLQADTSTANADAARAAGNAEAAGAAAVALFNNL